MQRTTFTSLFLAVLFTAGCAFQRTVKRGDDAMRAGNYEAAYAQYKAAAVRKPGNDRIHEKLDSARSAVIDRSLEQAEAAVERGAFHEAVKHLDRADAYAREGEPSAALRQRARAESEGRARAELADGDFWLAYQHALDSAELFGRNEALIGEVRKAAFIDTVKKSDAGDHPGAWSQYRAILSFEPELADELEARIDRERDAWVAALRRSAEQHVAKGDEGLAALMLGVAVALTEDDPKLERILTRLSDAHNLEVRWSVQGDDAVVGPIRAALRDTFGHSTSSSDFTIAIAGQQSCGESSTTRVESADYLAGTRIVDNPRKAQLATELDRARRDQDDEGDDLSGVSEELRRVRHDARPRLARAEEIDARLDELESRRRQEEIQLETDERYARDARDELNRIRAEDGDPTTIATWEEHVWEREAAVEQTRRRIRAIEAEIDALERKRAGLRVSSATSRLEHARQRVAEAQRDYDRAVEHVRQAELDYHNEPATIEQEVWETLDYPVETVTRTCSVTVRLSAGGAGSGATGVEASRSTRDETHAAFPVASIAADPLHLPQTGAALTDDAAHAAGARAADQAWTWLTEAYAQLLTPSDDPNLDVERHLAVCRSRPGMLTDASGERVRAVAADRVFGFDTAISAGLALSELCL